MNEPKKPDCLDTYRSPQLVDGGAVEDRTQNDIATDDWEEAENIIWGQLVTEPYDETV
jgi:hypothetical protein